MTFADKKQTARAARHLSRLELSGRRGLPFLPRKTEDYERGFTAGRKSLQPQWVSTEDHQPGKDGIYFAVIESEGSSFSEMFASGSGLVYRSVMSGFGRNRAAMTCRRSCSGKESHDMFAVIRENRDRSITRLLTCGSLEALIMALQLEKNKVPLQDRTAIRAVAMDDGGYVEILL